MAGSAVRLPSRGSSIASRRHKTRDDSAPAMLAILTVLPAARGIEPLIALMMATRKRLTNPPISPLPTTTDCASS